MKLVGTTQTRPHLTIEFTPEELDVLSVVCAKIAGDSEFSSRRVTDKLSDLLRDNGYDYRKTKFTKSSFIIDEDLLKGHLHFKDEI